jgi:DNA-binding NarL/FixJ family response regulator
VRVVIAEDHVLLRAGLERLLADEGVAVVAAVGDGGTGAAPPASEPA